MALQLVGMMAILTAKTVFLPFSSHEMHLPSYLSQMLVREDKLLIIRDGPFRLAKKQALNHQPLWNFCKWQKEEKERDKKVTKTCVCLIKFA